MERMTKAERLEAAGVAFLEGDFGSMDQAYTWTNKAAHSAMRLHKLYELACNRPLTVREEAETEGLESQIREHFASVSLGLYLNIDPRGNPVGILTPKTGRYNTMGGAECGWRL